MSGSRAETAYTAVLAHKDCPSGLSPSPAMLALDGERLAAHAMKPPVGRTDPKTRRDGKPGGSSLSTEARMLSPRQQQALAKLSELAVDGVVDRSIAQLAQALGMKPRRLQEMLCRLEDANAICRETVAGKHSKLVLVPTSVTTSVGDTSVPAGVRRRGAAQGCWHAVSGGEGGAPGTTLPGKAYVEAAAKAAAAASKIVVPEDASRGAAQGCGHAGNDQHAALHELAEAVRVLSLTVRDQTEVIAALSAELASLRAGQPRVSHDKPFAVVSPAAVHAAFHGDEAPQFGDKPPELHSRAPKGHDVNAPEKDETCNRLVRMLVEEGRSEQEAEAFAMKWRSHPRLKLAVATVQLQRARGGTIEAPSRFVPWLCKHDEELPAEGAAANWSEIDSLIASAVPRKRRKTEPEDEDDDEEPAKPLTHLDLVRIDERVKAEMRAELLSKCK